MAYTSSVLDFVLDEVIGMGINVLPIRAKRPLLDSWSAAQTQPQNPEVVEGWFADGTITGVAVVCGYGDVECIDFDDPGIWRRVHDAVAKDGAYEHFAWIRTGWSERAPNGGGHILYRCSAVGPNTKLASRVDLDDPKKRKSLIETRGVGGYVVVSPSHGDAHPSGEPYVRESGGPLLMARITPEERDDLFAFLRSFDEMPGKSFDAGPKTRSTAKVGDRPGDAYSATFDRNAWRELLVRDGWTYTHSSGTVDYYRRPGKDDGISASVNWDGRMRMRVFTTSTLLEEGMYSPFAYLTFWHHAGDWNAAARALAAEGFGNRPEPSGRYGRKRSDARPDRQGGGADSFEGDAEAESDGHSGLQVLAPGLAMTGGTFVATRETDEGLRITPLSNFVFRVTHDVIKEDGASTQRFYDIEAVHQNGEIRTATVPASEFGGLAWVSRELGPGWIVFAGMSTRDKVRQCAQHLTTDTGFEVSRVYQHTGWIDLDGKPAYLMASGAIDADGLRTDVTTELPGKLSLYDLPAPIAGDALRADALKQLRILDAADPAIVGPLYAMLPAALLNNIHPVDFAPHVYGRTGTFKTEFTSILTRHQGRRLNKRNAVSAHSTIGAQERLAFAAKDALLLIDDFVGETAADQVKMRGAHQRLARTVANGGGRNRLNRDASMNAEYFARCGLITTGEDAPGGHSATGRMLLIEVPPGAIDPHVLTELQIAGDEGAFERVTASVIQWLAAHQESVRKDYPEQIEANLVYFRKRPMAHSRHPDTLATLLAAGGVWLHVLQDLGALTKGEADTAWETMRSGIEDAGQAQSDGIQDADPCDQFLRLVSAAVAAGDVHLCDPEDNGQPANATVCGWTMQVIRTRDGTEPDYRPRGPRIGWVDNRGIFLLPDVALAAAQALGRSQGISIPWTAKTLGKRLNEGSHLLTTEAGRNVQKIRVAGSFQRVWHVESSKVIVKANGAPDEPTFIHADFRKESA